MSSPLGRAPFPADLGLQDEIKQAEVRRGQMPLVFFCGWSWLLPFFKNSSLRTYLENSSCVFNQWCCHLFVQGIAVVFACLFVVLGLGYQACMLPSFKPEDCAWDGSLSMFFLWVYCTFTETSCGLIRKKESASNWCTNLVPGQVRICIPSSTPCVCTLLRLSRRQVRLLAQAKGSQLKRHWNSMKIQLVQQFHKNHLIYFHVL